VTLMSYVPSSRKRRHVMGTPRLSKLKRLWTLFIRYRNGQSNASRAWRRACLPRTNFATWHLTGKTDNVCMALRRSDGERLDVVFPFFRGSKTRTKNCSSPKLANRLDWHARACSTCIFLRPKVVYQSHTPITTLQICIPSISCLSHSSPAFTHIFPISCMMPFSFPSLALVSHKKCFHCLFPVHHDTYPALYLGCISFHPSSRTIRIFHTHALVFPDS